MKRWVIERVKYQQGETLCNLEWECKIGTTISMQRDKGCCWDRLWSWFCFIQLWNDYMHSFISRLPHLEGIINICVSPFLLLSSILSPWNKINRNNTAFPLPRVTSMTLWNQACLTHVNLGTQNNMTGVTPCFLCPWSDTSSYQSLHSWKSRGTDLRLSLGTSCA